METLADQTLSTSSPGSLLKSNLKMKVAINLPSF